MHVGEWIAILLLLACVVEGLRARRATARLRATGRGRLGAGAKQLYSRRNLFVLAGATAGAAVLAFSGADEAIEEWHHEEVASPATAKVSKQVKEFGENYWVGVWVVMALLDRWLPSTLVSSFGRRCMEATLLGLPVLWTTQRVLGGSRPSDQYGPQFRPFADENSVSGHTFLGAVPWLMLARTVRPSWVKAAAVCVSPLTGWSRLQDRRHYPSQVVLGWLLAWQTTEAVSGVEREGESQSAPVPVQSV